MQISMAGEITRSIVIEQLWDYIKTQINGYYFTSRESLFYTLQNIWNTIPIQKIYNYYSSYLAQCAVCNEIGGKSLNDHWKKVIQYHDKYRIDLSFIQDPVTKQFRSIEIRKTIDIS